MLPKVLIMLVSMVLVSTGCTVFSERSNVRVLDQQPSQPKPMETEELKVYSTVLDALGERFGASRLLILNETTLGRVSPLSDPQEVGQFLRKRVPEGIAVEIVDEFVQKNRQPISLRDEIPTRMSHSLVENQDPRLSGEWEEFNKKNPGSTIVQLSRVAFDPDMTQALVYLSSLMGSRSGWGYYVFLSKHGQDWEIKQKQQAWVS
jgi:hypothetical protein